MLKSKHPFYHLKVPNRKSFFLVVLGFSLLFNACQQADNSAQEESVRPKIPVEVVTVKTGMIGDDLQLSANSIYLQRNIISAPIAGFIKQVHIYLGQEVKKGQVLYELVTKERSALGNEAIKVDSTLKNFGIIKIKASSDGVISTFDKQQSGEFVTEGTTLCTIATPSDLAFQVNVPYEYSKIVKLGKKGTVTLPDGSKHEIVVTTPLTAMDIASQTQTLLAKLTHPVLLPENLIAKVSFDKGNEGDAQILPKSCVLSDEMMQNFWVMKLLNDTTAVKVPVVIGNKNSEEIAIKRPKFDVNDRIIVSGNYGLPDTALVSITKQN